MDEPVILEFNDRDSAASFMASLDALAISNMGRTGYETWDAIGQSPSGSFYISSPGQDTRFAGWRDRIVLSGTERPMPPEWIPAILED